MQGSFLVPVWAQPMNCNIVSHWLSRYPEWPLQWDLQEFIWMKSSSIHGRCQSQNRLENFAFQMSSSLSSTQYVDICCQDFTPMLFFFQPAGSSFPLMQPGVKGVSAWVSTWKTIPSKLDTYRKISNVRCTLLGNKIVDHSVVVGASPVGAAPTTSSF